MLRPPMRLEDRIVFDASPAPDADGDDARDRRGPDGDAAEGRILAVDRSVDDAQSLVDAARDGVTVVEYDSRETTLAELRDLLASAGADMDILSIAFAGHGEAGRFAVAADGVLDLSSLTDNPEMADFILAVSGLVADGGRIDLLGCDVAAGELGADLVAALEKLTGVDFAASDNATGNPDEGGDWFLETDAVDVEAEYFEAEALAGFAGLLVDASSEDGNAHVHIPDEIALEWDDLDEYSQSLLSLFDGFEYELGNAEDLRFFTLEVRFHDAESAIVHLPDFLNIAIGGDGEGFRFEPLGDGSYQLHYGDAVLQGCVYDADGGLLRLEVLGNASGGLSFYRSIDGDSIIPVLPVGDARAESAFTFVDGDSDVGPDIRDAVDILCMVGTRFFGPEGGGEEHLIEETLPFRFTQPDPGISEPEHNDRGRTEGGDGIDATPPDRAVGPDGVAPERPEDGGGDDFERAGFNFDDEFEWAWRTDDEELVLEAEEALHAIYVAEGNEFQFAERILAGLENVKGLIRLLDENVAGAIVMLSHVEDLSGHGDLLDWVLDASKEAEGLRRESLDGLATLARGVKEWTALPAERRDGLSMDRLDEMNSRLEDGNLRIQGLVAGLKAFSEQVNDLRLADGPIIADGMLEEAMKVREVRERLIRDLAERRDAMYFDLRASNVLERHR